MTELKPAGEPGLYKRVVAILEDARTHVSRTVNTAMVHAYWLIGREILEVEQHGRERAGYGDQLIEGLAKRLTRRFGKGFSAPNIRNMRQFFLTYPHGSTLPEELGGPVKSLAAPSKSVATEIRSAAPSESVTPSIRLFPSSLGGRTTPFSCAS